MHSSVGNESSFSFEWRDEITNFCKLESNFHFNSNDFGMSWFTHYLFAIRCDKQCLFYFQVFYNDGNFRFLAKMSYNVEDASMHIVSALEFHVSCK